MKCEWKLARRAGGAQALRARRDVAVGAIAIGAILLIGTPLLSQASQTASQPKQIVTIKQMRVEPQQITVPAGAKVEWKNEDMFEHTVTADDGSFDSGLIKPGHSWSMTMSKSGKFAYHCRPHPNMTAGVEVQARSQQSK